MLSKFCRGFQFYLSYSSPITVKAFFSKANSSGTNRFYSERGKFEDKERKRAEERKDLSDELSLEDSKYEKKAFLKNGKNNNIDKNLVKEKITGFLHEQPQIPENIYTDKVEKEIAERVASNLEGLPKKNIQTLSPKNLERNFLELNKPIQKFKFLKNIGTEDYLKLMNNENLFFDGRNAVNFNLALTALRKFKKLQNFQRDEIKKCVNFISINLNKLSIEDISAFAVNLQRMRISDIEYYQRLESFLLENSTLFSVRALANILHSYIFISKKQNVLSDFFPLFRNMETVLALKLRNDKHFDPKSVCQIAVAYSKTQNFSQEFIYFIEQITLEKLPAFEPTELTQVAYSLYKNKVNGNHIFIALGELFLNYQEKFTMEEISLCLEMISKRNAMTKKLEECFKECFISRRDNANILDLGYFCEYFFQDEGTRGSKELEKSFLYVLKNLKRNMDINSFIKIFTNLHSVINAKRIKYEFLDILYESLEHLLKNNDIKRGLHTKIILSTLKNVKEMEVKEKFKTVLDKYKM